MKMFFTMNSQKRLKAVQHGLLHGTHQGYASHIVYSSSSETVVRKEKHIMSDAYSYSKPKSFVNEMTAFTSTGCEASFTNHVGLLYFQR
jgi:hypothetical protein